MKDKQLMIQIERPINETISFLLNPMNTPLWIDSLVKEATSEWPVKVGSTYRNQNRDGDWNEYTLTELNERSLTMVQRGGNYHVRYTLSPLDEGVTSLEYYEWVDNGDLQEPFTIDILEKLKQVLERKSMV